MSHAQIFTGQSRRQIEETLAAEGLPASHAATLLRWFYKAQQRQWHDAPRIPHRLKDQGAQLFPEGATTIQDALISHYDHSVKFLVRLSDGKLIESVLMPESSRITLCLSSQVGCRQACSFCHTGRMGLDRNLSAAEMVDQVVLANHWLKEHPSWLERCQLPSRHRVSNLVFMGMGEPLDNVANLSHALHILTEPLGLGLALSRISVSTAGHLDGLKELHRHHPNARVALSLHCVDDTKRSQLMPINRRFPMADVLAYLKGHHHGKKEGPFIQFTLIKGVNDDPATAEALAVLTKDLNPKINLIPLNPVSPSRLKSPEPEALQIFRDVLHQAGLRVMIRYSKGQDIQGACGQLVTEAQTLN